MGVESTDRPAMCEAQQAPSCESEVSSCGPDNGGSPSNSGGDGLIDIGLLSGDNTGLLGSLLSGTTLDLGSLLGGSALSAEADADVGDFGLSLALASTLSPDASACGPSGSLLDIVGADVLVDASLDIA